MHRARVRLAARAERAEHGKAQSHAMAEQSSLGGEIVDGVDHQRRLARQDLLGRRLFEELHARLQIRGRRNAQQMLLEHTGL